MKLKAWLRQDWMRKVAALFFGILIWYSVHLRLQKTDRAPPVQVRLEAQGDVVVLNADEVPRVVVTVRGSASRLEALSSGQVHVVVPVEEVPGKGGPLEVEKRILPEHVELPSGVSLVDVVPDRFVLRLDAKISELKPVQVSFVGERPPGYGVSHTIILPDNEVAVIGPRSLVQRINKVFTEEVDQATFAQHGRTDVLEFPQWGLQPSADLVQYQPKTVTLRIQLYPKDDSEWVDELPIGLLVPSDWPYKVTFLEPPSKRLRSVRVMGPRDKIDRLEADLVQPFLDLTGIDEPNEYTLDFRFAIGLERLRATKWMPASARIRVERRPDAAPEEPPKDAGEGASPKP